MAQEVSWQERVAMQAKPEGRVIYKQQWRDLLFMHYPMDPNEMRPHIPEGLDLDLFPDDQGRPSAWVGVVPFRMEGIRPKAAPAAPWLSSFPETNVRTYVHRNGKEPGVWFLSLDAARWMACKIARRQFGLAYWHAKMSVERHNEIVKYFSDRIEGTTSAILEATASIGPAAGICDPETLDFFLLERYLLYTQLKEELHKGRVWHRPYPIRGAKIESCNQSLTTAAGLPTFPWDHTMFSDGVDVDIYGLERV